MAHLDFPVGTRKMLDMATKTNVMLVDDLDGESPADTTVKFGIWGTEYEIDLTDDNAAEFRNALSKYVSAARKVGSTSKGRAAVRHHHRLERPRGSPSLGEGPGDRRVSARAHQGRCRRAVPGRRQLSLLPPTGAGPTGRVGAERGPPPCSTAGYRPRAAGGHRLATSSRTPAWPRWSSGLQQVPSWSRRIRRAPAE